MRPKSTTQASHITVTSAPYLCSTVALSTAAASNPTSVRTLGPIKMAGKTGTAQSHNYGSGHGAHGAQGAWALRDHAWFICFAPYDDPRYAMSVLVEHGGFGADAAAPKAAQIMKVALLKDPQVRARIVQPIPTSALIKPAEPRLTRA